MRPFPGVNISWGQYYKSFFGNFATNLLDFLEKFLKFFFGKISLYICKTLRNFSEFFSAAFCVENLTNLSENSFIVLGLTNRWNFEFFYQNTEYFLTFLKNLTFYQIFRWIARWNFFIRKQTFTDFDVRITLIKKWNFTYETLVERLLSLNAVKIMMVRRKT